MKMMALIILLLALLQPVACFAHPCESCLGNPESGDASGKSGNHTRNHDSDSCDSTVCCALYLDYNSDVTITYSPLVSIIVTPDWHQKLQNIVLPIFVPPQSLA